MSPDLSGCVDETVPRETGPLAFDDKQHAAPARRIFLLEREQRETLGLLNLRLSMAGSFAPADGTEQGRDQK